ncbi:MULTISPECIES: transposase [unclassified Streptomyces]|uniref:transposase n=1 Tax=unclassified Streptomyces TaxID=2593676 RepID=UPI00371DA863
MTRGLERCLRGGRGRAAHGWCESGLDTLLRLLRTAPFQAPGPVRVLGVDEFALLKGHTYATILVDLKVQRPIDVVPGREAEPVARRPSRGGDRVPGPRHSLCGGRQSGRSAGGSGR